MQISWTYTFMKIFQYAFGYLRWIGEVVSVEAVLPGSYCTRMLTRNRIDIGMVYPYYYTIDISPL